MTNKEKFLALVSKEKNNTLEKNKERIKNRAMLSESQQIAMKVLKKLDELGWTQKNLAKAMEVSPQHVNKIVSGKENLTIETQIKLQNILDIPVLASYYESRLKSIEELILTVEKKVERIYATTNLVPVNYQDSRKIKMEYDTLSGEYSYQLAV
ncbi:MAG: helix-turn-helix domain-containing protein [Bacteroidales bacterium]|nr:MAG: helix-turn-helix domain-containing protein [Bacteroidales bacterium]